MEDRDIDPKGEEKTYIVTFRSVDYSEYEVTALSKDHAIELIEDNIDNGEFIAEVYGSWDVCDCEEKVL